LALWTAKRILEHGIGLVKRRYCEQGFEIEAVLTIDCTVAGSAALSGFRP